MPTLLATEPLPDLIFADGFESGDCSTWTIGDCAGMDAAFALVGGHGVCFGGFPDCAGANLDDSPQHEPRFRARFYFAPDASMTAVAPSMVILEIFNLKTFPTPNN